MGEAVRGADDERLERVARVEVDAAALAADPTRLDPDARALAEPSPSAASARSDGWSSRTSNSMLTL